MKFAAIQDCWRSLQRPLHAANGITKIEQHLSKSAITYNPDGVFAVVGLNGAGKSCFFNYLTDQSYSKISFKKHTITLNDGNVLHFPGDKINATVIDISKELRNSTKALLDVKSTWGQQDATSFKEDEISLFNYVLSTCYSDVLFEEVLVSEDESVPLFSVVKNGVELNFEALSLGENLVFFIFWCLTRKYSSPGIFFVDEPESGLSPIAQERLVDLLVYISSKKSKQIFISTHSPFIVSKLGEERVILMTKNVSAEWSHTTSDNCLEELGMKPGLKGIIFLEDNKAKVFAEQLFSLYGSTLTKSHMLIFLKGESDVYEVVNRVPILKNGFNIYGLLDADQRNDKRYINGLNDKFFFLPGQFPPEQELINAIKKNIDEYSRSLLFSKRDLERHIRSCEGLDHHDFFEELSRKLYGNVNSKVYQDAFRVWLFNYHDINQIHDLMAAIDPKLAKENISYVDELFNSYQYRPLNIDEEVIDVLQPQPQPQPQKISEKECPKNFIYKIRSYFSLKL